ncbi:MAG: MFS transporter [Chloroflexota bacterium]|nr:MAG: MFS transporter [Chloroflexota bacterium]
MKPSKSSTGRSSDRIGSKRVVRRKALSTASIAVGRSSSPWVVYSIILVAIFIAQMGLGLRNSLTPFIVKSFGQTVESGVWLTLSAGIVSLSLVPTAGKLSDIVGRKYVAAIGLFLAAVGQVGVGISNNYAMAVASYALLGLVAATLLPAGPAFASVHIPESQRGRALGMYPLVTLPGTIVGPIVGGMLTDWHSWQLVMYVGATCCLISLVFTLIFMPRPAARQAVKMDWVGAACLIVTVACLLVLTNRAQVLGLANLWTWLLIAGVVVGGVVTALVEKGNPHAILETSYIASRRFIVPVLILLSVYSFGATTYMATFFVVSVIHGNATMTGLVVVGLFLPMAILGPFGGALADRFGAKNVATVGVLISCIALFLFTRVSPTTSLTDLIVYAAIQGVGIGLFFTSLMRIALSGITPDKAQTSAGTFAMFKDVDAPLVVSVYGTWFGVLTASLTTSALMARATELGVGKNVVDLIGKAGLKDPAVSQALASLGIKAQELQAYATEQAMPTAMATVFGFEVAIAVVALLLCIFFLPNPIASAKSKAEPDLVPQVKGSPSR